MSGRKLFIILMIVWFILFILGCALHDVAFKKINKVDTLYITTIDTTKINHLETEIALLEYELKLTRDSLAIAKDSLGEDLFVARYKIERIRYYNEIAGKNNNIRYLRGWINRVLND